MSDDAQATGVSRTRWEDDLSAILDALPAEARQRVIDAQLEDAALEREIRRGHTNEDLADRQAARLRAMVTLCCGWAVVAMSILGSLVGLVLMPAAWPGWCIVAAVGVGGPAAISLVARNTRLSIDIRPTAETAANGSPEAASAD